MQGIVEKDNRKEEGVQGMRKFYKGSLITAACLIGTGLILTAAGGAAGIHEAYGILKKEAVDRHERYISRCVLLSKRPIHKLHF